MSSCELCGQETDSITKVKIEGAKLSVCDSCAEMGEEVKTPSKKRKKKKKRSSSRPRDSEVLVEDYGKRVKSAREEEQLSLKELADDLNEKTSLLSKVEKQELKPDDALANKLAKKLGVDLYTNPEVTDYDTGDNADDRNATLGDVAKVKD